MQEVHLTADQLVYIARKNGKTPRLAVCSKCGEVWQISVQAVIPPSGYICPHCTSKEKEKRKSKLKAGLIKYALLTLLGVALYEWAAELAYIERGYKAIGGEVVFLFLPLFYWLIAVTLKDMCITFKEGLKCEGIDQHASKSSL